MQTQNINIEIEHLVNLGSDPQAYMLYGSYRNEEEYKDEDGSYAEKHADDYDYMTLQLAEFGRIRSTDSPRRAAGRY